MLGFLLWPPWIVSVSWFMAEAFQVERWGKEGGGGEEIENIH